MTTQVNPALIPPGIDPGPGGSGRTATVPAPSTSFSEVLGARTAAVQFSGHALERLRRRGIEVDELSMARLQGGVDRAASKGSRESVVFVDDKAFVVSVRNRTVITAVDSAHMREHVFTNIDSAVIA
ncbi:MAG TPA: TIGR02530 family flagellar biosynthesis protein [Capillimicrobium sp.]|jgi:flagellar operon protein|nr:TIGR02530 family flagellar biosynthesis protein [Capillimicrobium sp.]